jgi:hypothetical protein
MDARHTTAWMEVDDFEPGIFVNKQDEIWNAVLHTRFGDRVDLETVELAAFGTSAILDVVGVRAYFTSAVLDFNARLNVPHETRLRSFIVPGGDVADYHQLRLREFGARRAERDVIAGNPGAYGANCVYTSGAVPNNMSRIQVRETRVAIDGLISDAYDEAAVDNTWVSCHMGIGKFWLRTHAERASTSASMAPCASFILQELKMKPVPLEDDGGGAMVTGAGANSVKVADPAKAVPPETGGAGDIPLQEVESAGQAFIKTLDGYDVEMKNALLQAFLAKKYNLDPGAISAITQSTVGSTRSESDS